MMLVYYWSKILKKLRGAAIKNSTIDPSSKIESGSHIVNTQMGKHSFCGYDCEIINCEIGSFCSIANGVVIGGGSHPIDWVGTSPVFYEGRDSVKAKFSTFSRVAPKKTTVGHDVWIGQNALIKQGVSIGTGAVIGMGSVVTKDVPPYAIFAGNPAKLVRFRFDEIIIERLLSSKWWELDEDTLTRAAVHIKDPLAFLKFLE
ncbi:CatB-related O-acetyltransferase [Mariniradius saccharolyticus]|uniref:CatB-related O-acetyltransferase n=1 Tax=Mariniradius saccharolyticus TaxID=1245591 RepID=UPI0009DB4C50|nr:CatB-related O-acetyltransferase [Mariniradius saccharolyticus]